jgi:diguanylate cyclase (GGDEF)-like protein
LNQPAQLFSNGSRNLSAEDSFLDLLIETLENLDRPARGQFLQKFFKSMAQVELGEDFSLQCWEQMLARRQELQGQLSRPLSLKTIMVDVLSSSNYLRMPILMEYEDLKKLQINAATDPLTGLYNRRLFEEYFTKELNRAKRYSQHLALVMMDLHRFKEVNDRFGHLTGDQALQSAAVTLRKTLRTSDYAFRIGGDEFALLLPQSDPEQADTLARRLRAGFEMVTQSMKLDVPLALDFGVAVFPEDSDQKEALIRLADERLYQLKNESRKSAKPGPFVKAAASPLVPPFDAPLRPANAVTEIPVPKAPPRAKVAAAAAAPPALATAVVAAKQWSETRKWERVSLVGTRAYAQVHMNGEHSARVADLSYGGVALQVDPAVQLPVNFEAVLHVPILPPVKVHLRKVYEQSEQQNILRIGCAFVS